MRRARLTLAGNPTFTAMLFGLLGGLVGAVVMGLVAYTVPAANVAGNPFFIAAAKIIGFSGTLSWIFGWFLHVITGMVVGAVFGLAVSRTPRLRVLRIGPAIVVGLAAGLVAWVVLFLPVMYVLTPTLVSAGLSGGGLLVNIIFGVILGIMFMIGQVFFFVEPEKVAYKCMVCGSTFSTQEELRTHEAEKHLPPRAEKELTPQRA